MNTKLRSPACAACAATALARLPVDAHAATLKPNSSAFDSATDVDAVLERVRRVDRVVLDPHLAESELGREAVGPHERREAGTEVDGRVAVGGKQVVVAPDRERPGRDLLAAGRRGDRLVVVGHLERAEAPLAGEDRGDLVLAAALPTSQAMNVCHWSGPPSSAGAPAPAFLDALSSASSGRPLSGCSSFRHWHLASRWGSPRWVKLVAAASSGLSLGRSG